MNTYQKISDKIQEIVIDNPAHPQKLRWVNVSNAAKKEINFLRKEYNFDMDHLQASVATVFSQRPMVFKEDNYFFLILHFPVLKDGRTVPAEVEFFVGHGYLITLHNDNIPSLNEFFNLCKKDPNSLLSYDTESSATLLYELLEKMIKDCYTLIDHNSLRITDMEELIFSDEPRRAVRDILELRRNVINIRKIMQNHKNILNKLAEMESSLVSKGEMRKCYDHLVEHSKRIWEMLDNQKEMIEVLNSTNQALLDNKMTSVMKTLTIFSVIIFPLTLLAAIFSMRTEFMPIIHHRYGFWLIIGIMTIIATVMLAVFRKKRWL